LTRAPLLFVLAEEPATNRRAADPPARGTDRDR
jgi:hypothetical protein